MFGGPEERVVAFCVASGGSLTVDDVAAVQKWREAKPDRIVLVTNNTFELCPWADYLVAMDGKWWVEYGAAVSKQFNGRKFSQFSNKYAEKGPFRFFENTGASAISCAAYFKASTIFMLGYDCKVTNGKTHWHGSHKRPLTDAKSMPNWPKAFKRVAYSFPDRVIYNCTRSTALDVFPLLPLEKALGHDI